MDIIPSGEFPHARENHKGGSGGGFFREEREEELRAGLFYSVGRDHRAPAGQYDRRTGT